MGQIGNDHGAFNRGSRAMDEVGAGERIEAALSDIAAIACAGYGEGAVADYIPGLREVPPRQYGVAIACQDGTLYQAGEAGQRFSIQSISKLFTLALALRLAGEKVWARVGRNPCMRKFNSVSEVEANLGIPSNPFINAGALAITDLVVSHSSAPRRFLQDLLRRLIDTDDIFSDPRIARGEAEVGHRNAALGYLLKDYGNLDNRVEDVLSVYYTHCAIAMSCLELAQSALFLAGDGVSPITGQRIVSPDQTREINAVLATCGMYNGAGEFAFKVGLPAKSGVGGGILAIVPQRMTICAWSPELDPHGNSVVGQRILQHLVKQIRASVY